MKPGRQIHAPPPGVASLVRYFHVEAADAATALLPALPHSVLTVYLSGSTEVQIGSNHWVRTPVSFLSGSFTKAVRYRTTPGTVFVSVLFQPGASGLLFDIPADRLTDRLWPLDELVGPHKAAALRHELLTELAPRSWVERLSAWIDERALTRAARYARRAVRIANVFENPTTLARNCGLSLRQFERRFLSTYGQSLRDMRRLSRFIGALSRCAANAPDDCSLAMIAADCGYFDQAHMVHDFVELAGIAPSRIVVPNPDPLLKLMRYSSDELEVVTR